MKRGECEEPQPASPCRCAVPLPDDEEDSCFWCGKLLRGQVGEARGQVAKA